MRPSPSSRSRHRVSSSPLVVAVVARRAARPAPRRRPPATPLKVGLGYIPSVQFAQFYLADQAGYYADEGLEVTFQNEIDPNLVPKVGQGDLDLGMSDGTSVIPAVSQGIPIRYVATVYGQFPSIVFAKASSGITDRRRPRGQEDRHPRPLRLVVDHAPGAARLGRPDARRRRDRRVPGLRPGRRGRPGRRRRGDGLREQRAGPARAERDRGVRPPRRRRHARCPGPGLIASTATIAAKRDAVAGFVRATLRAMKEIVADAGEGARRRDRRGAGARPGPRRCRRRSSPRRSTRGSRAGQRPAPTASARSTAPAGRRRSSS